MTIEEALAILDRVLQREGLSDLQEQVFRQVWEGQTYVDIAAQTSYDPNYIKDVGYKLWKNLSESLGERVTKSNVRGILRRYSEDSCRNTASTLLGPQNPKSKILNPIRATSPDQEPRPRQDWGEATDTSVFFGRDQELAQLQQWLVGDRCRLVALLGMGGMGKTSLSAKLATQTQGAFEALIWRSLRNAPPLPDLLAGLLQFLCNQANMVLPEPTSERLLRLLECLRAQRCLVILDNVESILQGGGNTGRYRHGYEEYGDLFRRLGETQHQSCLLLTSREKPQEIAALEGENLPVRTLQLTGLNSQEGRAILQSKGFAGTEEKWQELIRHCGGNPLALKIVSTTIQELFDQNIAEFLDQGMVIFGGLRSLLEQQFNRLSSVEQQIMIWLAINREPVSLTTLKEDMVPKISPARLLEALESLRERCLVEGNTQGLVQPSVVMEYVSDRFIEQVCREIETQSLNLFLTHALIKAQVPDYLRESQERVILDPIAQRLLSTYGSVKAVATQLGRLLQKLHIEHGDSPGYGGGNLINLGRHLKLDLTGYDFSNLAVWQAYLQDVNLRGVNFSQADLSRSVFTEILGGILSTTFSPDGRLLATGDTHGDIRIWQVANGKLLFTNKGHKGWVWSVAFDPQGQRLASGSFDCTVKLWDTQTGACLQTLEGHTNYVQSVCFSPDGQILASSSFDQTLRLWDLKTGTCLRIFQGENRAWCWGIAFSPDGQLLASGMHDHRIKLWNIHTGECVQTLEGHTHWVSCVVFAPAWPEGIGRLGVPEGALLASSSYDRTIKLWNIHTGKCVQTLEGHTDAVLSIAFGLLPKEGAENLVLASSSIDQSVKLWEVATGECLRTMTGHTNRIWSVAVAPRQAQNSSPLLASGGDDHSLKWWNFSTGQCLKTIHGYTNAIFTIAASPDGRLLTSGGGDRTVRIWDTITGECLATLSGHTSWIWSVAFSPDGNWIASGGGDRTVRIWKTATGECLATLSGHTSWVWSVAFSADGNFLASSSEDHTIRIWDLRTYQCLRVLTGHQECVRDLALSPDAQTLISGSFDQTIKRWNIETGECLQTLSGHREAVLAVAVSPDGSACASGSSDQVVKLWSLDSGECLKTLEGHTNRIWSLAFSPDGRYLVSGSEDQTIRFWNVETGECLQILPGHTNLVSTVLFLTQVNSLGESDGNATEFISNHDAAQVLSSAPSNRLASSSLDETIRLWDIETGCCLRTLRAIRPYEEMKITDIRGLTNAQIATLIALGAVAE